LGSAAAPVRGPHGTVTAALNVSAHASRMAVQQLEQQVVPLMLEAAAQIEHDLGVG
jgi:IclR family pca regulon transcriptional regulator